MLKKWVCWRTETRLWAYVSSQLTDNETIWIERHLENCQSCQERLKEAEVTVPAVRAYRERETPASQSSWQDLQHRLETVGVSSPTPYNARSVGFRQTAVWGAVSFAIVLLAVGIKSGINWKSGANTPKYPIFATTPENRREPVVVSTKISGAPHPYSGPPTVSLPKRQSIQKIVSTKSENRLSDKSHLSKFGFLPPLQNMVNTDHSDLRHHQRLVAFSGRGAKAPVSAAYRMVSRRIVSRSGSSTENGRPKHAVGKVAALLVTGSRHGLTAMSVDGDHRAFEGPTREYVMGGVAAQSARQPVCSYVMSGIPAQGMLAGDNGADSEDHAARRGL